jgi:hypothetical protein
MRGPTAGLIVASEEAEHGVALRAELPLAGQTVLEHQARLLAEAGVAPIIVLAEQRTAALSAAVDRLRRDGLPVDLARSATEAAQRIGDTQRVLLTADGLVTEPAMITAMLAAPGPAVLTVPNRAEHAGHELIDAGARWGGLLLTDPLLFRQTADMLGEWDLSSTLLRQAVQSGAAQLPAAAAAPAPMLALVANPAAALAMEQALAERVVRRPAGLVDRFVSAPLARLAAPRAMAAMLDPLWFRAGAAAATVAAIATVLVGWPGAGLAALLLAGPLDTLGRFLAGIGRRNRRDHRRWSRARELLSAAALAALAWQLATASGTGTPVALAAATLAALAAGETHRRWIGRPVQPPLWLAEQDNLIWLLLPFAAMGWWTAGLAAQAGLAFASLIMLQRLTARG